MIKVIRPTPKDVYPRHRLFEHLDDMRRFPVVWISAPAGSGKTTLVSSYLEDRKTPCLWYRLDQGDSDLATFFYYMREAAKKAAPKKRLSLPLLTPEYHKGISTFVLRYFERLYDQFPFPFLLVFDNYQDVPLDAPLQEAMVNALSMIPEGVNVLVISRSDLPAPLSRLRVSRTVGFVEWEDIRLTEEEAGGLIGLGMDESPPADAMRQLCRLSNGWVAGFLLLYDGYQKGTLPPEFAGKRIFEEVFEYFAAEIFRHLDAEYQDFFLTTAHLPKVTVSMAEKLTGNPAAGSILRSMTRNNYFIMRHAGARAAYEYHPLYRYFLISRARAVFSSDRLSAIHRDAAVILEKSGMTEEAVMLLKDISDWKNMVKIVVSHAPGMLKQGRHRPLQTWLASLPSETKNENPRLLYWEAMSVLPFHPGRAEPVFKKAFTGFNRASDRIGAMLAAAGMINAVVNHYDNFASLGKWYAVLSDLALGAEKILDDETEASVVASLISAAICSERNDRELDTWEQRALNIPETPATINTKAQALRWAFTRRLIWSGGCHDALPLLHELRRLAQIRPSHPLLSIFAWSAEFQYHTCSGSHEDLLAAAKKLLEMSQETGIQTENMWIYVHTASGFINRLDVAGALEWLGCVPPGADGCPNWIKVIYHSQRMRIALIQEEHVQALHEGERAFEFAAKIGLRDMIASTQLLLAQLHHATGKRGKALALLGEARAHAELGGSTHLMMEVMRTDAQFAYDEGDNDRGLLLLRESLPLPREAGYLARHFDNPARTMALCEKALEAGVEVEYVQNMIRSRGFIPRTPPFHIENWPWPLKIYTLGRFAIVKDGAPHRSSRKAQQMPLRLLKVLISLGGREIAEADITEILWPEADGDSAHHSFENNLHRLRKLLGHGGLLRFSDGKLTLDSRYCWVDVWAFERLAALSDEEEKRGNTEKAWTLMEKALGLYRQNFLVGDRHEPWVISPSERLKSKYFDSLLNLGQALELSGNIERAACLYERGIAVDDRMEEVYRHLMTCYGILGKRGQALAAYERCRKVLDSAFGIAPSGETEAVLASILSGE